MSWGGFSIWLEGRLCSSRDYWASSLIFYAVTNEVIMRVYVYLYKIPKSLLRKMDDCNTAYSCSAINGDSFFFGYPCIPLFDARYFCIYNFIAFCWNVAFNRALGTGEPLFNMNSGRLQASLDRVETILTHSSWYSLKNQVGLYLDLFWLLRYFENHTEYFPEGNELPFFLLILAVELFLYLYSNFSFQDLTI